MYRSYLIAAATLPLAVISALAPVSHNHGDIIRRQMDPDSTCLVYGIDFQGGQSYFINTDSKAYFTLATQFEGCNNDSAQILLVNGDTSDEYECTSVPTVPDDTTRLSTCPITKSQMVTGIWTILTVGNNGNSVNPLAVQRDFYLTCGPQQTATVTDYAPYTLTVQSTSTYETTSTVTKTTSVPNGSTVTSVTTSIQTVTPKAVTVSKTSAIIRNFYRWTKTRSTETIVITPSCTVPPRQQYPDAWIHYKPTKIQLPMGVKVQQQRRSDREVNTGYARKRFENHRAASERSENKQQKQIRKRAPDGPTVTITTALPNNTTVTFTADPTTQTDTIITPATITTTGPPQTFYSTATSTITRPTPTYTDTDFVFTLTYVTKTMSVVWTTRTTSTPIANAAACTSAGGHFGDDWS